MKSSAIKPAKDEVKNLLTMFDFYLAQRGMGKPIDVLAEAVRDMRLIIGRILMDHFMGLAAEDAKSFTESLAEMLADCCEAAEDKGEGEDDYCRYCIEEILTPFEYAVEIKREFADDPILQKMLALDIPILRPFDYGMRGSIKVLETTKKRRVHR